MGKLVHYVLILVFLDLLLLITGQLSLSSPTSVIINAILDPAGMTSSGWWILLITGGIATITIFSTVVAGLVTRNIDILIFVPFAIGFSFLLGDFVTVYILLASYNIVLGTLIMAPVMVVFGLTVLEWLRGKD